MKYLWILLIFLTPVSSSMANEKEDKTFLVIFDKQELKKNKSSSAFIEMNFFETFKTKSYTGHSDEALLITIPNCQWDECEMGQKMVKVNKNTWVPLQEIAFRIIDLNESKENYQYFLAFQNAGKNTKKKNQALKIAL